MPKKLIADIFGSYREKNDLVSEPAQETVGTAEGQPADALAGAAPPPPPPAGEAPAPEGEGAI